MPHIVDEQFKPIKIKKDYDIVFVGRLTTVKHVEILIQATAQIKKSLPSIRVAIVGNGEERSRLEDLARTLGLTDQIDFLGYQPKLYEWYNRSKLSVLTSEREGFPFTVIESLKCGVPVIVSDCGDVPDIVKESINGRIISDYLDYNAYADVIVDLLRNPDRIDQYSKNCLRTFENFHSNSVQSVWEKIIAEILQNEDCV